MIILIFLFNYTEAIYTYFSLLINIVRLLALPEVNYHSIWLSVYFFFPIGAPIQTKSFHICL